MDDFCFVDIFENTYPTCWMLDGCWIERGDKNNSFICEKYKPCTPREKYKCLCAKMLCEKCCARNVV